ncbi:Zn-ribbon domain-containing OB-fold protein [Inquilinus sp.]|jgi:uncharacterized OB-fold protein|uniref:Zn-ribbon domain-containing OB-fold protein n=1 Tax=Inquilinus sp. TaxID=1932117 RepID=UPI003785131C
MDAIEAMGLHNPETVEFWSALKDGRFLMRRCGSCGEAHWYPRTVCPFCFSTETRWEDGVGQGTIYSYTVMRRAKVPYAIAFVTLAEGPTMMTNIVDCDFDRIRIGQPVRLVVRERGDGLPLPVFTPA